MATAKENLDDIHKPLDNLDVQYTKNGVSTSRPAMNIGFMESRSYIHFVLPPHSSNDTGQKSPEEEQWLENLAFLKEDLDWLLKLPYHRFWSQVLYDESLHKCLESYLSQAYRDYDLPHQNLSEDVLTSLKRIHKLIFLVYLRMSTYKESKENHMRPEVFGEIIYSNYIFDLPKIMDLCALYGTQNLSIVTKMVQNIFSTQFKYDEDLNRISQVVLEAFSSIEDALSLNLHDMLTICTIHQTNGLHRKKQFKISSFYGFLCYITDISFTLHSLFEVYPLACQVFYQNGAATRIATFYENAFPAIEKEIIKRIQQLEDQRLIEDIKRKFSLSKTLLVKNFRSIINYCCIQKILNSRLSCSENSNEVSNAEQFLDMFTEIVSEKYFLRDYNTLYPLETDFELLNEVGLVLDSQRLSYIFSSIHDSSETMPKSLQSSAVNGACPKIKKHNVPKPSSNTLRNAVDILRGEEFQPRNEECSGPTEQQITSLIRNVKELFQEFGDGFIEKCLEHYHYDHEKVIDALITDCLPDHLIILDRNLKRFTEDEEYDSGNSILSERKNIYDNDEFDVFSRKDVSMEKIHIGKKDKTPVTYESLTKDPESTFLKQLVLNYEDEENEYKQDADLYEDEYDDTYDSVMFGLNERALEGIPDTEPPDTDDQQNEESSEPVRDTSKDFCMNPEIIREKRQQRWESKQTSRGNRGRGEPSSDQNRQSKDRNKAHVGNHNRRKQADFKRTRGMIPS